MRAELIQLTVATLGRAPSPQEMTSWLAQLNSGTSLSALAQDLMFDEGGVGRFAGLSNTDILVNAYQALFGRLPDVSGLNYWLNEFAAGRVDLGNLVPSLLVGALASTGNSNDALILAARAQAANSFLQAAEESGVFNPQAAAQAVAAVLRSSVAEPGDEPSNLFDPNAGTPSSAVFTLAEALAIVADPSMTLPSEYEISDISTAYSDVAIADLPDPAVHVVIDGATNAAEYGYTLLDTGANLLAAPALVTTADGVEVSDGVTVADAATLNALNPAVAYPLVDTVAAIQGAAQAEIDAAISVALTGPETATLTVADAGTLLGRLTDTTGLTLNLSDSAANILGAAAGVIGASTSVALAGTETVTESAANANELLNRLTDTTGLTLNVSDTAAAITAAIGGGADLSSADSIEHTGAQGGATGVASVADTFVFTNGVNATIGGFENGVDVIDLTAIPTVGAVTFEALGSGVGYTQVSVTDNAGNAEVAFDISDNGVADFTITLTGFAAGSVDATDFAF